MKKNIFLRYLFLVLSLATMLVIFFFSSQNGNQSSVTSGIFSKWLGEVLQPIMPAGTITAMLSIVRKLAHVTVYTVLGAFVTLCVFTFDFRHGWHYLLIPVIICLLYACSDEIHQIFVAGRDGKVLDVLIDGIGILISAFICNLIRFLMGRKKDGKRVAQDGDDNEKMT